VKNLINIKVKAMTEYKNNLENNIKQKTYDLKDEQGRCPSCDSSNVEIYHKNGLGFMICNDCGSKTLID